MHRDLVVIVRRWADRLEETPADRLTVWRSEIERLKRWIEATPIRERNAAIAGLEHAVRLLKRRVPVRDVKKHFMNPCCREVCRIIEGDIGRAIGEAKGAIQRERAAKIQPETMPTTQKATKR